jgi:hypothetical protein
LPAHKPNSLVSPDPAATVKPRQLKGLRPVEKPVVVPRLTLQTWPRLLTSTWPHHASYRYTG